MKNEEAAKTILAFLKIDIETDNLDQLIETLKKSDRQIQKFLDKHIAVKIIKNDYTADILIKNILNYLYEPTECEINKAIDKKLSLLIGEFMSDIDCYNTIIKLFPLKIEYCPISMSLLHSKKAALLGNITNAKDLFEIYRSENDESVKNLIFDKIQSILNKSCIYDKLNYLTNYQGIEKINKLIIASIEKRKFDQNEISMLINYYKKTDNIDIGKLIYISLKTIKRPSLEHLTIADKIISILLKNHLKQAGLEETHAKILENIDIIISNEINKNLTIETYARYFSVLNNNCKSKKILGEKIISQLNQALEKTTSLDYLLSLAGKLGELKEAEKLIAEKLADLSNTFLTTEINMFEFIGNLKYYLTLSYDYKVSPAIRKIIEQAGETKMANYTLINVVAYLNDYKENEIIWYILERTALKLLNQSYNLIILIDAYNLIHRQSKQLNEVVEQKITRAIQDKIYNITKKSNTDDFLQILKNGVPDNFKKICTEKAIELL